MSSLSDHARSEFDARLGDKAVVAAFYSLLGGMASIHAFELVPNVKGRKKALHFRTGKVSYFAVIANREWLLFYFRQPGLRDRIFSFAELATHFPELGYSKRSDPAKIEGLLKLRNVSDVERAMAFVRQVVGRIPKM
jgi:hypothetical protein